MRISRDDAIRCFAKKDAAAFVSKNQRAPRVTTTLPGTHDHDIDDTPRTISIDTRDTTLHFHLFSLSGMLSIGRAGSSPSGRRMLPCHRRDRDGDDDDNDVLLLLLLFLPDVLLLLLLLLLFLPYAR